MHIDNSFGGNIMSNIHIDASNMSYLVNNAFQNCLFKDTEVNTKNITVEGLNNVFFLHLSTSLLYVT